MEPETVTMLEDLEKNISERGLLVYGVDAVGNPVNWLEPSLIDVRFTVYGGIYKYELPALMRPLLKGPIEEEAFDEMVDGGARAHHRRRATARYGVCVTATYDDGAALGCPDCMTGEPHVCPFIYADELPEPRRSWALDHMGQELADEISEARAQSLS